MGGYSLPFIIALASNAFFFFSFQGTFPVLPRYIAEVVVQRPPNSVGSEVGLATTIVALVAVLTRIPAGQLADRFGRRRFMLLGATCFVLAPLIYAASQDMSLLILGRIVHGFGLATFTTAFQALITDLTPEERRGEALGLAGASVSIAFVTAPPAGDWMAATLGYDSFFQMSAVTAAVSTLLVAFIAAPPRPKAQEEATGPQGWAGLKMALAQQRMRAGVLTMAALGIPFGAFITFLPLLADEQQAIGVGLTYAVYAGIIMLAQPWAGRLSDRIGRRGVILPGLLLTSLAAALLFFDASRSTFILSGVIFGVGGGLTRGGVDALVQDSVPSSLRGTAAAVQYTSFDFWIGLGTYPMGLLANATGYGPTFMAAGGFCLLGSGTLSLTLRGMKK